MKSSISINRLTKSYTTQSTDIVVDHDRQPARTRMVLRELTMTIPAEKITVILGRSGCGKSTLLHLLNGDMQPDDGEIILPEGWHTTLLSAEPYVISWTSVLRNVAMAAGVGKNPEERMMLARRLVQAVGLEEYADLTPQELSTGMKQRLGLARVLASQAQLLLMDEPFASLDFITREELQRLLLTIQERMPRTIVLVTHQLEEALILGHRIVVMHTSGEMSEFDLEGLPYPRDLGSEEAKRLRYMLREACRR